jgi:hypothetical protein
VPNSKVDSWPYLEALDKAGKASQEQALAYWGQVSYEENQVLRMLPLDLLKSKWPTLYLAGVKRSTLIWF